MRKKYIIISICVGCLAMVGLIAILISNYKWKQLPIDIEVENIIKVKISVKINGVTQSAEVNPDEWCALFEKLSNLKGYETDYPENFAADEIIISIRYKNESVTTIMFGADRVKQAIIYENEQRIYNIRNYRFEDFEEFLN